MSNVARHLLLVLLAAVAAGPLLWLVAGAFGGEGGPTSANFADLLRAESFGRWAVNSLFVATVQTLATLLLCGLGGFAVWAYRFRGRRAVVALLAAVALVPGQVVLPGLFGLTVNLRLLDTFAAVILPGSVSAFGVFLYAAAFRHVPRSLLDAARLDGASEPRLWWDVAMPAVRPTTGAFVLLSFLASWNNLLWPSAVLVGEGRYTLPIALNNLAGQASFEARPGLLMAATLLAILPVVGLFFLCQRDFVSGLTAGSGK